jgi:tetratricopeptide (TPR) repeat protein
MRRSNTLRIGLILLVGALTYSNSLSGPFINDDRVAIVSNTHIRQLWPPAGVLFPERELPVAGRPLVNLAFALNYAIGGLEVRGYHIANVAIHLLCALVLFGIVRHTLNLPTFRDRFSARSADLACASSMLWMLHPLQTEAVNYLTQRTESMMALFFLLTVYAAIRAGFPPRQRFWALASVASCALGMLCKESMATVPLIVVLYDRVFVFDSLKQALRTRWRLYAGLAATWLELGLLLQAGPRVHSAGFSSGAEPWTYLLNQTIMIVQYLKLVVWPRALVLDYGVPRDLQLVDVLPYAVVVVTLLVTTAVMLVREPALGFFGAWFFITLAPTSSIVPIATEVGAERRMYLPLAALVVLAVIAASILWERPRTRTKSRGRAGAVSARPWPVAATCLFGVACALLAAATVARNSEYASGVTLARTVVERWPHGRAHMMLGFELLAAGRRDEAIAELRQAGQDYPRARYTLGLALFEDGRLEEAMTELEHFIRLQPDLLQVITARETIGRALERQGKLDEAAGQFRTILKMTPSYADAHLRLANVLLEQQRFDEASAEYQQFLKDRPADLTVASNLGISLAAAGRIGEALPWFRRAVDIEPGDAHAQRNLANALVDGGDFDGAVLHARRALALQPEDPVAHNILGLALASQQKFDEAIAEFRQSLRFDSGYGEARDNLIRAERAKSGSARR